ncbi:uncharacterized protein Z518_05604 [Rhinocladiella mackenziei CBS 650.93]|uniref:Uncharacterized protein n=1 Tax=Rhinocladiella mackenziei CBS 650.93 TaxID=1442369 RepID=A0A0D2IG03_9EURO|nr:uncharacterized protein Z518_05604 [Rhinocladiella mackenziei CBS 650.93]KIX04734.1 hypothetical protein Z518_05604 [Rhinocladiella mackenziei CBS 650.93]
MPTATRTYDLGVQKVSANIPVEDMIYLLKRDGGVFIQGLIAEGDVDQAYEDCRKRGNFFSKETQRAPSLLALSSTYAKTQKLQKTNGGTRFIPGSHLRGSFRKTPPDVNLCDILLHGGGYNQTENEKRLVFATFVTRGYLRQEENQLLAAPAEVARKYPREIQEYMGYELELLLDVFSSYSEWFSFHAYKGT